MRREGRIPAILYGRRNESILLSVDIHEFEIAVKNRSINQVLINLTIQNDDSQQKPVMIKELQVHPVSQSLLHVDFYEIDMKRKIRVNVPIVTVGKARGEEVGGILQIIRRELEVLCLPSEIPETIRIDVSNLDVGDAVHVEEIPLEGNIEIPTEVNFTVVTVLSPKVEEVAAEAEEGEEAEEAPAEAAEEE
jgi:large subunit ribosomal protein L25